MSSRFSIRRSEFAGDHGIGETASFVAAVAEGLVLRMAAAAEAQGGAPGQAERAAVGVDQFEIAFDAE